MTEMKAQILQYVQKRPGATFAELRRDIAGFNGEFDMRLNEFESIVLWTQMSSDAVHALNDLLHEQSLFMIPTPYLTYLADGACLNYPIAKSVRNFKKPRWLPVVFTHKKPEIAAKRRK